MSWMEKLYQTYEAGLKLDLPLEEQLMPICHTPQNAHIKVTIDGNGNFKRAEVLEKTQIVLPATESSASRSSGEAPHPFSDKIQYVAKDYPDFGGKKKPYFNSYFELLSEWCLSSIAHPKVCAVKEYVEKGTVVGDLIKSKVLHVDSKNVLLENWEKIGSIEPPLIFKVLPKSDGGFDQGNALVCWSVELPGDAESDTWKDPTIYKSWINFDLSKDGTKGLCYVTGKIVSFAVNHPAKLRHSGDKAKLISSNDMDGFTFRGRFTDSKDTIKNSGLQSVGVGFDVSQKAHNALRWLISRQGYRNGDQAIITWAVSGKKVPQPTDSSLDFLSKEIKNEIIISSEKEYYIDHSVDLGYTFALALKKYMTGYSAKLGQREKIVIMAIDSATPGRMAVAYYQEFFPDDYIFNLSNWHENFAWYQRYKLETDEEDGKKNSYVSWFPGTPSPKTIMETVFGEKMSDSLKKNVMERLLPCIVENKPFPRDLMLGAFRRVVNRVAYKSDEQWLWEMNLGVACSLYKGYCNSQTNNKKEYRMGIEEENCSRDYLYGRLLAIAERIEEIALSVSKENRSTTAARLMQRFADRPASTWRNIELALSPYMQRLKSNRPGFLYNMQMLLDEVMGKFNSAEFSSDKSLSGEFLLAYHSQRLTLMQKKSNNDNESNE